MRRDVPAGPQLESGGRGERRVIALFPASPQRAEARVEDALEFAHRRGRQIRRSSDDDVGKREDPSGHQNPVSFF